MTAGVTSRLQLLHTRRKEEAKVLNTVGGLDTSSHEVAEPPQQLTQTANVTTRAQLVKQRKLDTLKQVLVKQGREEHF